jgi:hypothetical protein
VFSNLPEGAAFECPLCGADGFDFASVMERVVVEPMYKCVGCTFHFSDPHKYVKGTTGHEMYKKFRTPHV